MSVNFIIIQIVQLQIEFVPWSIFIDNIEFQFKFVYLEELIQKTNLFKNATHQHSES